MQGRVIQLVAKASLCDIQLIRRIACVGAAVDIAFQHLQAKPQTLSGGHAVIHLLRQLPGFAQQRLGVVHQFDVGIARVAVNRQLQGVNAARAGRNQRNHRAAQTGGEGIDVDAQLLLLRDVEHVKRHDAGNTQLQQL